MALAIEPMVNAGKPAVKVLGDGWTAVTKDQTLSAHFEHTVVVTEDGCRILTLPEESEQLDARGSAGASASADPSAGSGSSRAKSRDERAHV
jgi:methionyl aminopeptidase